MKTITKQEILFSINYFFNYQTSYNYSYFLNSYHAKICISCPFCNAFSKFYKHGYYKPAYSVNHLLIVQCAHCRHTCVVYPAYLEKTGKISYAQKLALTNQYITTKISYRKIALEYSISTSYAYNIVTRFKNLSLNQLTTNILTLYPNFDITFIDKQLPIAKPWKLADTPDKLLNALQCVQLINRVNSQLYNGLDKFIEYKKLDINILSKSDYFPHNSEQKIYFFYGDNINKVRNVKKLKKYDRK